MADSHDVEFVDVILEEFLDIENCEFHPRNGDEVSQRHHIKILPPSEFMSIIFSLKNTNPTLIFDCENSDALNNKLSGEFFQLLYTLSPNKESNAERSWKKFHSSLQNTITIIQEDFPSINRRFLILISLKYFDKLIQINIFKHEILSQFSFKGIDTAERDIITYIGGSIISKLMKKYYKNDNLVTILRSMKTTLDCEDTNMTMTKVLDRGGLTYINEKAVNFFILLEICFREMYPAEYAAHKLSKTEFFTKCKSNVAIRENYLGAIETGSSCEPIIAQSMMLCLDAFFIIRAHHKCRRMMQCYLKETKCKKSKPGSKGLRSELKTTSK